VDAAEAALAAGQLLVAEPRQRAAAARVLDADPRQARVEIVAAVLEEGAGLDPVADRQRRRVVARPHRRRQAVGAVVHQRDGFLRERLAAERRL